MLHKYCTRLLVSLWMSLPANVLVKEQLGCDDVTCAAEIGGALGAEFLLAGRVAKLSNNLIIHPHGLSGYITGYLVCILREAT